MKDNIYTRNGYSDRREYLESLADNFGVPFETVEACADLLGGEVEDFDGLVTCLEDEFD